MKKSSLLLIAIIISFTSCKKINKDTAEKETAIAENEVVTSNEIIISLFPKSNSNASGEVVFNEENGIVSMTATMNGLEPGVHAIHIHQSSDCSSPDGKSTGGLGIQPTNLMVNGV